MRDVANITQTFAVRDSTATPEGKRLTGLSPAWAFFVNLTTGVPITPQPAIVEVGGGQYRFSYDPEANGEAAGQINAMPIGPPLTAESDQYIDMVVTRDSSRILTALPASVAGAVGGLPTISQVTYPGGGTGPALAGVQLASSEHLAIQGDVGTGLTTQGYTTTRAIRIDALNSGPVTLTTGQVVSTDISARIVGALPTASPGTAGGLPTVNSMNQVEIDPSFIVDSGGNMTVTFAKWLQIVLSLLVQRYAVQQNYPVAGEQTTTYYRMDGVTPTLITTIGFDGQGRPLSRATPVIS